MRKKSQISLVFAAICLTCLPFGTVSSANGAYSSPSFKKNTVAAKSRQQYNSGQDLSTVSQRLDLLENSIDELYVSIAVSPAFKEAQDRSSDDTKLNSLEDRLNSLSQDLNRIKDHLNKVVSTFEKQQTNLLTMEKEFLKQGMQLTQLDTAMRSLMEYAQQQHVLTQKTKAPTQETVATGQRYVVKSGDTLGGIALKLRTSVKALVAANNLKSENCIVVNQELLIP
jgi:LysM repeat protein